MVQAVLQRSAWLQLVQEALALLQQSTQHSLDPSSKDEQRWPQQCVQWPPIEIVRGRYLPVVLRNRFLSFLPVCLYELGLFFHLPHLVCFPRWPGLPWELWED